MRHFITAALLTAGLLTAGISSADASEAAPQSTDAIVNVSDAGLTDVSVIGGYETDLWTLSLRAGVSYTIVVDGDGDSDLDIVLRDENGRVIDSDLDYTDFCVVTVTPRWSGPFELEIRNLGRRANLYELTVR